MPIVEVNRRKVHYQELNKGARRTVVLIHGMLGNLAVYYFRIAPLLAERFHVVLYDLKSHGLSEKATEGYDLGSMSADLLGLMDVLALERVHLAGYSFGALIALKAAVCRPERFDDLAIIEGPDPSDEKPLRIMMEYSKKAFDEWLEVSGIAMGARQLERHHELYEFIFQRTTMQQDVQKEKVFFSGEEIAGIPHRALLIYGKQSDCVMAGHLLARRMRDGRLLLVDGDHQVPVQSPDVVAGALLDFWEH